MIDLVCKKVGIKQSDIDINHESIYRYYEMSSAFYGLFQIEDGLTKEVIRRVKPKNIDQLASCISISRPGSLRYIDDYVKFVQTGDRKLIHPLVDDLLAQTGGLILYQEQINSICQTVYGMSAVDSDAVRYAIGKKKREEMEKWEPVVFSQGKLLGIPEEVTKWFWDTCSASADYLFNANHCLSPDTIIDTSEGFVPMYAVKRGDNVRAFNVDRQEDEYVEVVNIIPGRKELWEVELEDGRKIKASMDHKFLCSDMKMHELREVISDDLRIITD